MFHLNINITCIKQEKKLWFYQFLFVVELFLHAYRQMFTSDNQYFLCPT